MNVFTFTVEIKQPRKGSRLPAQRNVTYRSLNGTYTLTFFTQKSCEDFIASLVNDKYTQAD